MIHFDTTNLDIRMRGVTLPVSELFLKTKRIEVSESNMVISVSISLTADTTATATNDLEIEGIYKQYNFSLQLSELLQRKSDNPGLTAEHLACDLLIETFEQNSLWVGRFTKQNIIL